MYAVKEVFVMKCDFNCSNCKFEDCISDEVTYAEMCSQDEYDRETKERSEYQKTRYEKYDKKYYEANKARILAKQAENKAIKNEYARKSYWKNPEKERQRQKERYWRKKAEKVS